MNEGLREGGGGDSAYPSHVKSVMSFHFTLEGVGETEKGAAAGIDRVLAAAAVFPPRIASCRPFRGGGRVQFL